MRILYLITLLVFLSSVTGCKINRISGEKLNNDKKKFFDGGLSSFYSGNYEEAIDSLKIIVPGDSNYINSLIIRARSLFLLGKKTEAVKLLEKAVKNYPDCSEVLFWAGKLSFLNGDVKRAENYLLKYIKTSNYNFEALYILGEINRSRKRYERAIKFFEDVESLIDIIALSKIRKAQIFLDSGEIDRAKKEISFIRENGALITVEVRSLAVDLISKYGISMKE